MKPTACLVQGFYNLMPEINFSQKVEEQHNVAQ